MKTTLLTLTLALTITACTTNTKNTTTIAQPYLGQQPPGNTPIPFVPGMVSTEHYEYSGVFTPNMQEFYYIKQGGTHKDAKMLRYIYKNNQWQQEIVSNYIGQPVISPNGTTMHLGNKYRERTPNGWSQVKQLKAPFSNQHIMRLSSAANGNYYFDTYHKDQPKFPIRYAEQVDGKHQTPKALSNAINTGIKNFNHPFIAPNESYLLWDAVREDGNGSSDIYISFKQPDGTWGNAINLGDKINTKAWEASASVTPDGKYLFFSRNMGSDNYENVDIFWVDAQVIEELRDKI